MNTTTPSTSLGANIQTTTTHGVGHGRPTLLELIVSDAPATINGVTQSVFDGVSFVKNLASKDVPSDHITQYYESGNVNGSFDDDIWELYHLANDFSECPDVANKFPDKLKELQELWWSEAERNQVLPLNNQSGRFGDRRHAGGYSLYLKGRRLHYAYNFLGALVTTVSASIELPPEETLVRATFTATGRFKGDMKLWYGDVPVGSASIPFTMPVTFGVEPFTVGYQRMTPITPELTGKAVITEGEARAAMAMQ